MFTHAIVYDGSQSFGIIHDAKDMHNNDNVNVLKYDDFVILLVKTQNEVLTTEEFFGAIRQGHSGPHQLFSDFPDDINNDEHLQVWYETTEWALSILTEQILPAVREHETWDISEEGDVAIAYWIEKVYTRD